MAAAAVMPMAQRTAHSSVHSILEWAPAQSPAGSTRSAVGMDRAWSALKGQTPAPLVLIGSAPTAMDLLLDRVQAGAPAPSLIVGMPVGFVGVLESKRRLAESGLPHIRLDGSRGGAGLAASVVNALLMAAVA